MTFDSSDCDAVPRVSGLKDVYFEEDLSVQAERWNRLKKAFSEAFGAPCNLVARSPGRVNLIGEHVDYSHLPCLPMALTVDVLVAVRRTEEPGVVISNVSPQFPKKVRERESSGALHIDSADGDWTNYVAAGFNGGMELLRRKGVYEAAELSGGLQLMVDGTVPPGGGLSSSAALVCASLLAVLAAFGQTPVLRQELAQAAIVAERSVGVNSGGMDQSASVFGKREALLWVEFAPSLRTEPLTIVSEPAIVFLVADTRVSSVKHETAPERYNLRAVEVALGVRMLMKNAGVEASDDGHLGPTLHSFMSAYCRISSNQAVSVLEDAVLRTLPIVESLQEVYTLEELPEATGLDRTTMDRDFLCGKFPVRASELRPRQRLRHVLRETLRVISFRRLVTESGESVGESESLHSRLGRLLDESQTSLQDDFECSCAEIETVCAIAKRHGSYGSRLTGAGWGGCTVHLLDPGKVQGVMEALEREYYGPRGLSGDGAMTLSRGGLGSCFVEL